MLAGDLIEDVIDGVEKSVDYESKNRGLCNKFHWKIRSRLIQKEDME